MFIRPITVVVHELGHAIPALLFGSKLVNIYIGSYGDPSDSLKIKIGRFTAFFKYDLVLWKSGLCTFNNQNLSAFQKLFVLLFGPLTSLIFGTSLVIFAFSCSENEGLHYTSMVVLASCLYDFYVNMIPNKQPFQLYDGSLCYNDGQQIVQQFRYIRLPKEVKKVVDIYSEAKYEEVIPMGKALLEKGIVNESLYFSVIYAALDLKHYDDFYYVFKRYSKDYRLLDVDYYNAGVVCFTLEKQEEGLRYYDKAIALNPQNADALNNRGYYYLNHEKYEAALADFNNAIFIDNQHFYAYNNRGLSFIKIGDLEKGFEDIQISKSINENNPYVYLYLGIYYLEKGAAREALENLNKAKGIDKSLPNLEALIQNAKSYL